MRGSQCGEMKSATQNHSLERSEDRRSAQCRSAARTREAKSVIDETLHGITSLYSFVISRTANERDTKLQDWSNEAHPRRTGTTEEVAHESQ